MFVVQVLDYMLGPEIVSNHEAALNSGKEGAELLSAIARGSQGHLFLQSVVISIVLNCGIWASVSLTLCQEGTLSTFWLNEDEVPIFALSKILSLLKTKTC